MYSWRTSRNVWLKRKDIDIMHNPADQTVFGIREANEAMGAIPG
jgi:hypothetical protein